ncbi:MAG: hypothetical protein ACUVXJ_11515 [Phycisphaerae bacterium]
MGCIVTATWHNATLGITCEEGHCPGVLWEDYQCDGFVTETQKRELRSFREQLDKMKP